MASCDHHDGMPDCCNTRLAGPTWFLKFRTCSLLRDYRLPTGILLAVSQIYPGPVLCWAAGPTWKSSPGSRDRGASMVDGRHQAGRPVTRWWC